MTEQNDAAAGPAQTDANDWRVTVRLPEAGQASKAVEHLSAHEVEDEVHRRLSGRVVVGTSGGSEVFLYTPTQDAAAAARQSVADLLAVHGMQAEFAVERWHPVAEEWEAADVRLPATPAEVQAERQELDAAETSDSLAAGVALFEVRVQVPAHRDAVALAARLQAEGYSVVRRWRFLVVGANNADQAEEFAARIRPEVPAGAVVSIEEVGPRRPYTVFELLAGSGL
ncbi:MAG TPA: hypothetical protein VNW50_00805 [Streptosporangiaceae bacterium]|nr:hypothetical protein [Streptosporangiaceae bacterium]